MRWLDLGGVWGGRDLGAQVVGRQLLGNKSKPPEDDTINDLIHRLLQLQPLAL